MKGWPGWSAGTPVQRPATRVSMRSVGQPQAQPTADLFKMQHHQSTAQSVGVCRERICNKVLQKLYRLARIVSGEN
jgi:hypothetical protein